MLSTSKCIHGCQRAWRVGRRIRNRRSIVARSLIRSSSGTTVWLLATRCGKVDSKISKASEAYVRESFLLNPIVPPLSYQDPPAPTSLSPQRFEFGDIASAEGMTVERRSSTERPELSDLVQVAKSSWIVKIDKIQRSRAHYC